jgi:hypothetical protein
MDGCSCHSKIDDLSNSVPGGGTVAVSFVSAMELHRKVFLQQLIVIQLMNTVPVAVEPEEALPSSRKISDESYPEPFE